MSLQRREACKLAAMCGLALSRFLVERRINHGINSLEEGDPRFSPIIETLSRTIYAYFYTPLESQGLKVSAISSLKIASYTVHCWSIPRTP